MHVRGHTCHRYFGKVLGDRQNVFSVVTKLYFTVAGAATLAGVAFVLASGDRAGFLPLVLAGAIAVVLGVAAFGYVEPEVLEELDTGEIGAPRPADSTDIPESNSWPLVAAIAVGVLSVGTALGNGFVFLGFLAAIIAATGWFAQAWREHPSWTQEMSDRITDRFILPFALPVTVFLMVAISVISVSRVLLAVSKNTSIYIAFGLAVATLAAGWVVATREQIGRAAFSGLVVFTAMAVLGAGVAGAMKGEREFGEEEGHEGAGAAPAVRVVAKAIVFDRTKLELAADTKVSIEFDNDDTGVPHNISILDSPEATRVIFRSPIITGPKKETYEFDAPPAGEYYFQCDVHPAQMSGTVVVVADTSEAPAAGSSTTSSTAGD
jgi:plastocyanin